MTVIDPATSPDGVAVAATPARPSGWRQALKDPVIVGTLVVLAVVVAACAAAPLLTPFDPTRSAVGDILAPPSATHPLGGDGVGRDVLARLLHGGRSSLLGALCAVVTALVVGGPAGLIAGYFRGAFDAVSGWLFNLVMAIPGIVVVLVILIVVGNNIYIAMSAFGVLLAPNVFRLIRASVTAVRGELYVDAARVAGLSEARIMRRHILRVAVAPLFIQAAQLFGVGIVIQSGLEFLGLGSSTRPSWGAMLNDAFTNIYVAPVLLVWPAGAIVVTVVAASLLASAVRDRYQGRGRSNSVPARRRPSRTASPVAAVPVAVDGDDLLIVDGLHVAYGTSEVVSDVSFSVRKGEVLGIVGETGSGKSQTAFSVMGLLPASAERTAQRITFGGRDLMRLSPSELNRLRGARIGYIPQEPMSNLDPNFTVGSQLVEPMRRHLRIGAAPARDRAAALLARVGIRDPQRVLDAYPHELSGGMAQRVLIAGAVSCDPDLVIADEPTTALDVTVQAEVLELMRSLQQERGMAMMFVTHDFGVVADICDRVIVMRDGGIVEAADLDVLFDAPRHPYTRTLLASSLADAPSRMERHA
jgi:peptide/nickel transport system permease protein